MGKLSSAKIACIAIVFGAVTALPSPAQVFTTLHSFDGTDGANPPAPLVQGRDGNLYGTTVNCKDGGGGTLFQITPGGRLKTLYSFCGSNGSDGMFPWGALIQATDGSFYRTTAAGGANAVGTVFKVTPSGTLTTLYNFCSQSYCTDGASPYAGVVEATDGNFYGTTVTGGNNNEGTVFKITSTGAFTTLYSFCSQSECTDGSSPQAALIQAADGNFYGTTEEGGNSNLGTVFKITPSGTLTTLYNFCSLSECADGEAPYAGLIQATNGNLYGSTVEGGATSGGTVFEITPSGALTTLYNFCSQSKCTDGDNPYGALLQANDGNFYGTTVNGGANLGGTVFKITPSGILTTVYDFCSENDCADGDNPYAAPTQHTKGELYGITWDGGTTNYGTVFSVDVDLNPFVETQPASGKVGRVVEILGTELTGATDVSFNGTAATFTVVSNSFLTTTVPTGANTGSVTVTTPSGTLKSNKRFIVTP
jgi:uncharacterized repeat protein (TIGR03803 family)